MIKEVTILGQPIDLHILRNGQMPPHRVRQGLLPVAVNGEGRPAPVIAEMQVEGQEVTVQLSVVFVASPVSKLMPWDESTQQGQLRLPGPVLLGRVLREDARH